MAASQFNIIVRSFSASGAANQMIKPPVSVFGIGGRYASAIYSAAVKAKELEAVEKDFDKFENAMHQDKKFNQIVKDPTIKKTLKAQALREAASKLSFSKTSTNAIALIAENGRLKNFKQIQLSLKTIMSAYRGEIFCEIISAKPLSDTQRKDIENALKKFTKGKETIHVQSKVDPKIIGGIIVSIGDKYVDLSIASKIKKYMDVIQVAV